MPKYLVLKTGSYYGDTVAKVETPNGVEIVSGRDADYESSDASTIVWFLASLLRHGIIKAVDHDGHKWFYKQDADKLENVL